MSSRLPWMLAARFCAGTWMTYFLMFQLGFMVIGWLYSLWRILLALVVMLLYSVAALDRSLLHTAQASALMLRKPCAHLHAVCPPAEDHQSPYIHGKLRMQPTVSHCI